MGMVLIFFYGLLTSFVLSGASRNRREGRDNPAMLVWTGHALIGVSITAAAVFGLMAATGMPLPAEA